MSFCTKDFCKHCICFKPKVFKLDPDNHTVLDSFVPDSDIKINGLVGHNLINLLSESEFFCYKIDKFLTNILELIINKVKNKKYSFKTIFTAYANNELKMLEIRFDFIEDYILSSIRNVANIENREEWEKRHDTGEFVKICAWCNKIFYNSKFQSLDKVVYETDLFERGVIPTFTHGICGECKNKVFGEYLN